MARSVKVNYILNLINTGTQMLFPLLTFPYACRVIQAEGIGLVNFYASIIAYISLFTCLGIPLYAVREVARVRNNIKMMNRTVVEILSLHAMLTFLGYIVVVILSLTVPQIKECLPLFLIMSLNIFFAAIGCEWFYQGIEDFLYITIRGLIVKVVSVALLFILVRTKDDLIMYGWYSVIGAVGGNIFNFIRLRKYIHRENIIFSELNIKRHIKPVLQVFSFSVITSIYLQLNPVLLGFMKGSLAVGFFAAATKVKTMLMKLSSILGTVMLPRVSNLIAEKKEKEFNTLIQKSYDFTLATTLPIATGLIFCSPCIIMVLCGNEFRPAILTSQIMGPIIVMVGLSNVMGMQVLYPKGKLNIVIKCCLIGAITDLILNIIFIPSLSFNGTAIAYTGAEIATTASMTLMARKYLTINFIKKSHFKYITGCALIAIAVVMESRINISNLNILIVQILTGISIYGITLLITKDEFVFQIISIVMKKNKNKKYEQI